MPYDLPPLRFAPNALEPHVRRAALAHHHDVVHAGYTAALNDLLARHPEIDGRTVEDLLRGIDAVPATIRQQVQHLAGGHANHQFLWKILGPPGRGRPTGDLAGEIDRSFGSFAAFRDAFDAAALALPTEGWAFLSLDRPRTGALEIVVLPGNGSVLPIAKPGILICDLWDHGAGGEGADRGAGLAAFWNVVDWDACNDRLVGLRAGRTHL